MSKISEQTKATHAAVDAYLNELGVTYRADFVPFSTSRNRDNKDKSLNWVVSLGREGQKSFVTDYMQGIGHLPGYKQLWGRPSYDERQEQKARIEWGAEKGRHCRMGLGGHAYGGAPLPQPAAAEVLHCLLLDASVLDYRTFEEWAREFGYGEDSRKAEAIYKACIAQAVGLRAILSDDEQAHLRELLQDY